MSNGGYWGDAEINLTPEQSKGKEISPRQETSLESMPLPDKPTAAWVKAQLPNAVWDSTRSSLNPQSIAQMGELARKGLPKSIVVARMGYTASTARMWEMKAMSGEQPYLLWLQIVSHGSSVKQEELLQRIWMASATDWKAAAWWAAKIDPETFGENKGGGTPTTVNITNVADDTKTTINRLDQEGTRKILDLMAQIPNALPPVDAEVVEDSNDSSDQS